MNAHSAEKDAPRSLPIWCSSCLPGRPCFVHDPADHSPPAEKDAASELRAFADFIVGPTVPGLDDDTLLEVYLEAHARADQIARQPIEREEIAMPKNELVTALTDAIREEIDLGGDAESITTTVLSSEWAVVVVADARASGMRTLGGQFQQRGLEEAARVAFDAAETLGTEAP